MEKKHEELLKKTSVLLVEDNDELRKKFKLILSTYVEEVFEASNGQDAIELFVQKKPNFVITDFKLPLLDGLDLTTFIRKLNKYIPIIVISAYTEKEALVEFASMNLIQYIIKPIDFEHLDHLLKKCACELLENGLIEVHLSENSIYSFSKKHIIKDNGYVSLSPNEIKFLELLIQNKKKLVTLDMIEYEIYENEVFTDSALNNLVSKLRKKIGVDVIKNIPKTGYLLIS
tara:strand:+ start:16111 stop:16800 length:690 start_codon:yes stop_codon:yes gene_type:complete